jgi:hypothetical protein
MIEITVRMYQTIFIIKVGYKIRVKVKNAAFTIVKYLELLIIAKAMFINLKRKIRSRTIPIMFGKKGHRCKVLTMAYTIHQPNFHPSQTKSKAVRICLNFNLVQNKMKTKKVALGYSRKLRISELKLKEILANKM